MQTCFVRKCNGIQCSWEGGWKLQLHSRRGTRICVTRERTCCMHHHYNSGSDARSNCSRPRYSSRNRVALLNHHLCTSCRIFLSLCTLLGGWSSDWYMGKSFPFRDPAGARIQVLRTVRSQSISGLTVSQSLLSTAWSGCWGPGVG